MQLASLAMLNETFFCDFQRLVKIVLKRKRKLKCSQEIVGKRLSQVPIEDEISQLTTAAAKVENEVDEEEEKSVESSSTKVDDDDFSAEKASSSISAPLSFLIGTFNESNTDYNQILKPQKQ